MWVAKPSKQALVGVFLALLGLSIGGGSGWYYGKQQGIAKGLTSYHQMCYTGGPGFVIIDGNVVLCGPGGKLSEQEKQQLDKGMKTWYNKYIQ